MAVRHQLSEGLTATGREALDLEKIELDCLLEAVYRRYGFDFREYAPASLRRRVNRRVKLEALPSISALQDQLLHDPDVMQRLLLDLSINVTAMFRDPTFHVALRELDLRDAAAFATRAAVDGFVNVLGRMAELALDEGVGLDPLAEFRVLVAILLAQAADLHQIGYHCY